MNIYSASPDSLIMTRVMELFLKDTIPKWILHKYVCVYIYIYIYTHTHTKLNIKVKS